MILRSVVGKLWITIIILVSLVLILLSLFLNEQIEKTYVQDQKKSLELLAKNVQTSLQSGNADQEKYLKNAVEISNLFDTYLAIVNLDGSVKQVKGAPQQPLPNGLIELANLPQVFRGSMVSTTGRVTNQEATVPIFKNDVSLVAVPFKNGEKIDGAILLYQTKDQLSETDIKKQIFYSALIGIALTTVFAFFLSTRITQPMIQMQKAAEKMARGQFSARVKVRAHERDEIADLAMSFNRMAGQLEESINLLSHEKEQLTSILKSMTDGVISLNAHGKIIMSNPPADLLLAHQRNAGEETVYKDLPESLQQIFELVVKEEAEQFGDITEQGRTWAVVMAPLYARDQVRGAVAVLRDVTEERRLEKLRKDFVANVSHELRTPLSMLQGYSEALMDDIAETPEVRKEIAHIVNDESQRMSRLVQELLDLARMEAGHIDLDLTNLDLEQYVPRVVRKFQNLAREQGITLEYKVAENLPFVLWDEDRIEQVLTNLIGNAIRHTPKDGRVTVHCFQQNDWMILEVEDTGTGIPEEDLPFVFERFYKADKARTRKSNSGGTGLGLSIVKHLVHAHQGNVSVRSKLGEGTTFSVQLPVEVKDVIE